MRARFFSIYDLKNEGTLLDLSCGEGAFLKCVSDYFPALFLHGVDILPSILERAKKRCPLATFVQADAVQLPYPDATFDMVLTSMSLHHYKEPLKVFSEIARVLRRGGVAHIIDIMPRNHALQLFKNFDGCPEPYHFERYYTLPEVECFAESAGLRMQSSRRIYLFGGHTVCTFVHA